MSSSLSLPMAVPESRQAIEHASELSCSTQARRVAYDCIVWQRCIFALDLIEEQPKRGRNLFMPVQPCDIVETGLVENSSGVAAWVGKTEHRAAAAKVFIELGRHLLVAVAGLQHQQAVRAHHFLQRIPVWDRGRKFHYRI